MAAPTIDAYLAGLDTDVAAVARHLRALVESELPGTPSRMYQGIPVWFIREKMSVGIKANRADVALLLFTGQRIADPTGLLRPSGSFELASVKLATPGDVDETIIRDWLRQAKAVEG